LIDAGRAPDTPALAALNVERPGARLIGTTLAELAQALDTLEPSAPVFIAVGAACAAAIRAAIQRVEAAANLSAAGG
jgi:siroheme synthase